MQITNASILSLTALLSLASTSVSALPTFRPEEHDLATRDFAELQEGLYNLFTRSPKKHDEKKESSKEKVPAAYQEAMKPFLKGGAKAKGHRRVMCHHNGSAHSWTLKDGKIVSTKSRGKSHYSHGHAGAEHSKDHKGKHSKEHMKGEKHSKDSKKKDSKPKDSKKDDKSKSEHEKAEHEKEEKKKAEHEKADHEKAEHEKAEMEKESKEKKVDAKKDEKKADKVDAKKDEKKADKHDSKKHESKKDKHDSKKGKHSKEVGKHKKGADVPASDKTMAYCISFEADSKKGKRSLLDEDEFDMEARSFDDEDYSAYEARDFDDSSYGNFFDARAIDEYASDFEPRSFEMNSEDWIDYE